MGTFGQYTGRHTPLHGAWDHAFRKHMHRLGGLGRFGNAPDAALVTCWDTEVASWRQTVATPYGTMNNLAPGKNVRWLGTMICPKPDPWGRHLLYDIMAVMADEYDVPADPANPKRPLMVGIVRTGYADDTYLNVGRAEGIGVFERRMRTGTTEHGTSAAPYAGEPEIYDADAAGFARTHSNLGVAHRGIGAGSVLYAGMALAAIDAGFKGNYSIEGTRSNSAASMWKSCRNPRSGPLATRAQAAIARSPDGSVDKGHSVNMGDSSNCLDEHLIMQPSASGSCGPSTRAACSTDGATREDYVSYDYIDQEGIRRWGLLLFNVPRIKGEGLIMAKREPGELPPYAVRSGWKNDDVKTAFGMKVSPNSLTAQSAALQKYSRSLSEAGLDLVARADVGPSVALIVKIAGVLQGRDPARAVEFLRREDIASTLMKTGAGKVILASQGLGTPLAGLGRAAFRDITAAAATAEARPLSLTLPPISRATQSFVNSYPDEG